MQVLRNAPSILVSEPEAEMRGYLETALKCFGYSVELVQRGDEALERLQVPGRELSAVLLDLTGDGLETLREIRARDGRLPVIAISGEASTADAVAAMKLGATDFLAKPLAYHDLQSALGRALLAAHKPATPPARQARPESRLLGGSAPMRELQSILERIGWSEAPVLIQGETGSGKEVLARELHALSPRAQKPFLKLNCAALPSELVESELFGYERGSFTGAFQRKAGMFELADGGTIMLDEIGDMEVRLQAKLLHVLQDREFQRIGGRETIKVDVRVIAATHRDLEAAIADGAFREDLYYRLNVLNLTVPPLRQRPEDIVPLAEFLLKRHAAHGVEPPSLPLPLQNALLHYHWPGNVRELENIMRKLIVLRDPGLIIQELNSKAQRRQAQGAPASENLPAAAAAAAPEGLPALEAITRANQQAEAELITAALHSTRWNRKQAAILLGIDYKALLYKMKKLGLDGKPDAACGASASSRAMTVHGD